MTKREFCNKVARMGGIYDTKKYRYIVDGNDFEGYILKRLPIDIIGTTASIGANWEIVYQEDLKVKSKVLYWVDESRKYGDKFFSHPTFDREKAIRDAWIRWDGLTKSEQRRASVCVDFCEYSGKEEDPETAFSELEESVFFPDYDCINISVDNWESIVSLMDDEIREAVHSDLAPCYPAAFLAEYEKRHLEKYGEPFHY